MGKRDWGGTVLVACMIALAGLLHDHTVPLALLCAGAVASATVVVLDVRSKPAKQRQRGDIKAGESIEADGTIEAGKGIDAGRSIRAGAPAWSPPPLPPESPGAPVLRAMGQHPEQRDQRRHAIKRGNDLLGLIFQAELQNVPGKTSEIVYYNLAAMVEAWARGIRSPDEVQRFSGDTGADLARLKLLVQTEVERLRALQESI